MNNNIFNNKCQEKKPSIACIGGGTGLHTLLSGLKERFPDAKISAIVSMMDSGGSTGKLRDEFGYLPPGDIRQSLVALSDAPNELRALMQHRFHAETSALHGHVIGNLFLTALKDIHHGDEYAAIEAMEKILRIRGKVYPITLTNCHLVAKLENGNIVRGETNIDVPKHDPGLRIVGLALDPPAKLFEKTRTVLLNADYIIIGPGDLYTSLMPNLIVDDMVETLQQAKEHGAKIIFITNTMTKNGETNGFTASSFLAAVQEVLNGVTIDAVIANIGTISPEQLLAYAAENAEPVICDFDSDNTDHNTTNNSSLVVITDDLVNKEHFARHNAQQLAKNVQRTIQQLQSSNCVVKEIASSIITENEQKSDDEW